MASATVATSPPRDRAPRVPAALLLAGVTVGVLAQGGFHPRGALLLGLCLVAAVVASAALPVPSGLTERRPTVAGADAAALALVAWALGRGVAVGRPAAGLAWAAVAVAFVVAARLVRTLPREGADLLVTGLLTVGAGLAVSAWAGVAGHVPAWAAPHDGVWRAHTTLTYANATAALLVPLALLSVGVAARPGAPRASRALAVLLLVGAGATGSRGGAVALLGGGVVLCLALGWRRVGAVAAGPLVGAAIGLAGLVPAAVGQSATPLPAVLGLAGGLAVALLPVRWTGLVALAGGVAGTVVAASSPAFAALAEARLTVASPDRSGATAAALDRWAESLWLGVGPGHALLQWQRPDGATVVGRYVHDEYLQVGLQLGVVGVVLVVWLLLAATAGLRRAVRRRPGDPVTVAAGTGVVAVLVASGLDFLWHIPVVVITTGALAGLSGRTTEGGNSEDNEE